VLTTCQAAVKKQHGHLKVKNGISSRNEMRLKWSGSFATAPIKNDEQIGNTADLSVT